MKFEYIQNFPATVPQTLSLLTSQEFFTSLTGFDRIEAPVLRERTIKKSTIELRVHYRFIADLPPAALAVVDPNKLSWEEQTVWSKGTPPAAVSTFVPDHYKNRLRASATTVLLPNQEKKRCTQRIINMTINVSLLLVSKQVENAIADGLKQYLAHEEQCILALLEEKKLQTKK